MSVLKVKNLTGKNSDAVFIPFSHMLALNTNFKEKMSVDYTLFHSVGLLRMDALLEDLSPEKEDDIFADSEDKREDEILREIGSPKAEKRCEGELLGSVKAVNCPGVRASARVIQKMKQDLTRPITPPPDRKVDFIKDEKGLQKTPNQSKSSKVVWSNVEKNLFFDALNEFGRDFESIANFINSKLKRKGSFDAGFKSKEQVRQTFYQTFHKILKFIKFSDEVKKPAQELYALINYGEMRRRLTFVSEKNLTKIKDLVYKGYATLRSKGKNLRIKTPSCKALRKLNQLEDLLEDIKLPSKVELYLRPASMESWGRVQSLAQNPVVRTVVPLQKKLISVIRTFQHRWRSQDAKINEETLKVIGTGLLNDPIRSEAQVGQVSFESAPINLNEALICFTPHRDAVIHRPLVSITEYLSSFNICLNSYEERLGVKVRGELLCHEKQTTKRQRSDSGCEKKSPEHKRFRTDVDRQLDMDIGSEKEDKDEKDLIQYSSSDLNADLLGDILAFNDYGIEDRIFPLERQDSNDGEYCKSDSAYESEYQRNVFLSLKDSQSPESAIKVGDSSAKLSEAQKQQKKKELKYGPRKRDKKDANNLRPLISEDVMRRMRKGWTVLNCGDITIGDLYIAFGQDSKLMFEYSWLDKKISGQSEEGGILSNANNYDNEEASVIKHVRESSLGNKLKQLLLIAHLHDNVRRNPCYCGHSCEKTSRSLVSEDITSRSYISNKTVTSSQTDNVVFRQPVAPFRRNSVGLKNKGTRFGVIGSKQIVVKRLLPVRNGVIPEIEVKTVQNHFTSAQTSTEEEESDDGVEYEQENDEDNDENIENNNDVQSEENTILESSHQDPINDHVSLDNSNNSEIEHENHILEIEKDKPPPDNNVVSIFNEKVTNSLDDVPDLSQLLSLNSPLPISTLDESTSIDDIMNTIPPLSPMQIIRENISDPKWLEDNINDFSLSSFLGHLEEISSRDGSENTNMSALNETSMDYMRKFADITASMQSEEKDVSNV